MERLENTATVVRKLAFLTLLGFLVVVLSPAIVMVLSFVVPFALIGFLVWGGFQLLVHGRQVAWQRTRAFGGGLVAVLGGLVAAPGRVFGAARSVGRFAWQKASGLGRFVGSILFQMLGGALVGGVLGVLGGLHYHDGHVRVPVGILGGALVGLVAAVLLKGPAKPVGIRTTEAVR
ncbi:MAG TPA: hypothetical protein VG013_29990 [Gemmataceae bacterium]|jgi:hypothetical protein|nr:hypothetical protein [Gemmataceae bacterium]